MLIAPRIGFTITLAAATESLFNARAQPRHQAQAKAPYTVMQHAMHILPTVSEHIPTMLGELRLL
jgi:hypothetical protein